MSAIYPIAVPKWGIEMVEGTVNNWLKQAGDDVNKGDEILEIESDKIVNVWEAPADGVLRRLLVEEGEARAVGQLLGVIAGADVSEDSIDAFIASYSDEAPADEPEAATPSPAPAATTSPAAKPAASGSTGGRASPVVKRLAEELGVDIDQVAGTGRNGRITQDDVRAAAENGPAAPSTAPAVDGDYEDIPLSATRKTIAQRLTSAKQDIPHYYLTVDWEVDNLLALREQMNADAPVKISLNDMLVYCVARALVAEPRVNIHVTEDTVRQFKQANVAVAIATDDGLFPATIYGADSLGVEEIAQRRADLVSRANTGELTRDDLAGATFTVSNLGMYGIDQFTAIINPPMGALLALGRAQERCVARNGQVETATLISATLSCDHRAIDGAIGAQFLAALQSEIEQLGQQT